VFGRSTQAWFDETFVEPTEVQRRGWPVIASGEHALLVAPTGSGKTLAAFLAGIDAAAALPADAAPGVRVLYVSPLKALVYDVERNLRAPLAGIRRTAERFETAMRPIDVDVRTGDTPQRERQRQARRPAEILVTTPESLFLILGSRAREGLRTVQTVIVDEVHAMAPTKRGTHLALSLERLAELTERDPQRIGLSATVRPLDEMARFLGGARPVEVVDASAPPKLDLRVVVPVPDMENVPAPDESRPGGPILGELYTREMNIPQKERGIWPAIYPELLERIRENRSTIVFVNSRGLCERLAQRLNDLAEEELVRAHHGSISHTKRTEIEEGLKRGSIKGIVATSSLELGIDMGAVDLVLLVESPGSVARGLQRVGRAGHQVDAISTGRVFPKFKGDLLEAAVIAARMRRGEIESLSVPRNVLDVLAQQIVAMCCDAPRTVDEIERVVRRAEPFRELSRSGLHAVLDMLSGRYPSSDFAGLRPLLSWDRTRDRLSPRRGAAMVSRMNAGTIPDRGLYGVFLGPDGPRVGELDEEMVHETRLGDHVMLGASTWRVEEITRDRVVVSPAPGEPGRLPFWKGEGPGRPIELGHALGAFVRRVGELPRERAVEWLAEEAALDAFAAENLVGYIHDQREQTGGLPTDRSITIERFRDELGDWRVCILTPFGSRIHAPWSMAIRRLLTGRSDGDVQVMYTDDGIVLRFADVDELPDPTALIPDPDEIEDLVTEQLADTALFAGLFRENAVRSLLMPRRRPTQRNPLWAQRLKAQQLLSTVRRYPSFPIVIETYRQALGDVFDMPGLTGLLRDVRSRAVRVHEVETRRASPFARSIVFAYVAAYMYESDAPSAERRAQALTLDRGLLAELLGQAELRELIDPQVLDELERELQHLADGYRARDADELHDLLRHLGDLSLAETDERSTGDPQPWLAELADQRRAIEIGVGGEPRWVAAENAALYRDALGCMPPSGLPDTFLQPVERPLESLLARFARHHGPFQPEQPAERYGLRASQVEPVLRQLESDGVLVLGEIRPGGSRLDWCDAEILRRLKRRTLARLRKEVAPVDAGTLGAFLPGWHGVGSPRRGQDRLLEAVARLEGLALPWSTLSMVLLPERVAGFRLDTLDVLAASGAVVWVGRGAVGARDGRVVLCLREHAAVLLPPPEPYEPASGLHAAILGHLEQRGASFIVELQRNALKADPSANREAFREALWDLVWQGLVTNDTFAPLRSLGHATPRNTRSRARRHGTATGGRWSLVADLTDPDVTDTERSVALANMLLERYGIVSREAAHVEELPGGFTAVYRTLRTMEETGRVRRGYFVEGLSGAQFSPAGAADRLRAARNEEERDEPCTEGDVRVLAALDPANAYGALLPWPATGAADEESEHRPRRIPGAAVVLVRGRPALYLGPRGRNLVTFPDTARRAPGALDVAIDALHRLPPGLRRGRVIVEKIDGRPARESPHYERLRERGLQVDYRGLVVEPRF
jgi:ATP-dependent Lhr-like helicase